jgi:hypothetical protein
MILATLAAECQSRHRAHERAMADYAHEVAELTADFERRIAPVVRQSPTAPRTELWLAIALANTFLQEQHEASTTLILVSDGVYTTGSAPVQPRADDVIVVKSMAWATRETWATGRDDSRVCEPPSSPSPWCPLVTDPRCSRE